jgi:TolB-like protein
MRFLHPVMLLALSVTAEAQDCEDESSRALPTDVLVTSFDILADAPVAIAQAMPSDIAETLDADPCVEARAERAVSEISPKYILGGSVYAEGQRAFVALRLMDANTSELVWSENYDYRGITAEMMARDILLFLRALPAERR